VKGLAKLTAKERCVALDRDGKQCHRQAVAVERYHGDDQLYGFLTERADLGWVRIAVCSVHQKKA
jgi:hypothetical protein